MIVIKYEQVYGHEVIPHVVPITCLKWVVTPEVLILLRNLLEKKKHKTFLSGKTMHRNRSTKATHLYKD